MVRIDRMGFNAFDNKKSFERLQESKNFTNTVFEKKSDLEMNIKKEDNEDTSKDVRFEEPTLTSQPNLSSKRVSSFGYENLFRQQSNELWKYADLADKSNPQKGLNAIIAQSWGKKAAQLGGNNFDTVPENIYGNYNTIHMSGKYSKDQNSITLTDAGRLVNHNKNNYFDYAFSSITNSGKEDNSNTYVGSISNTYVNGKFSLYADATISKRDDKTDDYTSNAIDVNVGTKWNIIPGVKVSDGDGKKYVAYETGGSVYASGNFNNHKTKVTIDENTLSGSSNYFEARGGANYGIGTNNLGRIELSLEGYYGMSNDRESWSYGLYASNSKIGGPFTVPNITSKQSDEKIYRAGMLTGLTIGTSQFTNNDKYDLSVTGFINGIPFFDNDEYAIVANGKYKLNKSELFGFNTSYTVMPSATSFDANVYYQFSAIENKLNGIISAGYEKNHTNKGPYFGAGFNYTF